MLQISMKSNLKKKITSYLSEDNYSRRNGSMQVLVIFLPTYISQYMLLHSDVLKSVFSNTQFSIILDISDTSSIIGIT